MLFSQQLSAYYPDTSYGGDKLYADLVEQSIHADKLGYDAVSLTEHHLINILLLPAPLQMAVKIACMTKQIKIMTSVVVLPLHDMRTYAGEVVVADILTEGRLMLGVGRGAFKFEMNRLGVEMEDTREIFDESLNVLMKLLTEEEVSWNGKYYQFDPLTVMPRPISQPFPLMMAVMVPEGIYHCTKRGFHIQSTPLSGNHQLLVDQVNAFNRGKDELGAAGDHLTMSLSRVTFVVRDEKDKQEKMRQAYEYYSRFDNVYTGPGRVKNGNIEVIPRKQSMEDLEKNLLICTPSEMIDQLSVYSEVGIDRMIINMNFGMSQQENLDSIQQFAEEVMPHFAE